jgi:hypothetical protein
VTDVWEKLKVHVDNIITKWLTGSVICFTDDGITWLGM